MDGDCAIRGGFFIGKAIEMHHVHACFETCRDTHRCIINDYALVGCEAHHLASLPIKRGIGFPSAQCVSAEQAFFKKWGEAATFHGATNFLLGAVGDDGLKMIRQRQKRFSHTVDGEKFGAHALFHTFPHVGFQGCIPIAQRYVMALGQGLDNREKTYATEFFKILRCGKGQVELGQYLTEDASEQYFTVDQGAVGIEK